MIIELCDFDRLCQKYNGKDLLDLLDKVYDSFDNFCEQFAVQKLETVGRTYVACGGLKVCESEVDPRLLGNHHTVRVCEFACSAISFINSITLKDGKKANIKVGIHTGEAVVGILGDTKPQFSIIGPTLDRAYETCSNAPAGKILVTSQCYKTVKSKVNNFSFNSQIIESSNDTVETCYLLHKRKNVKRLDKRERIRKAENDKSLARPEAAIHNPFEPLN